MNANIFVILFLKSKLLAVYLNQKSSNFYKILYTDLSIHFLTQNVYKSKDMYSVQCTQLFTISQIFGQPTNHYFVPRLLNYKCV